MGIQYQHCCALCLEGCTDLARGMEQHVPSLLLSWSFPSDRLRGLLVVAEPSVVTSSLPTPLIARPHRSHRTTHRIDLASTSSTASTKHDKTHLSVMHLTTAFAFPRRAWTLDNSETLMCTQLPEWAAPSFAFVALHAHIDCHRLPRKPEISIALAARLPLPLCSFL